MHPVSFRKTAGPIFAAIALMATPASALDFQNYDTGPNQEKLALIPGDQVHRVFYSLYLEDALQANQVLLAMTEFMATSTSRWRRWRVMLVRRVPNTKLVTRSRSLVMACRKCRNMRE